MLDIQEKLVELLEERRMQASEVLGSMNKGFGAWYADYLIANGVTIQKWISVEKRLPERDATKTDNFGRPKSVRVLCTCKQRSGKVFVKEGYCVWDGDHVYWSIPGSIDDVTHWMPLPEPPKGD